MNYGSTVGLTHFKYIQTLGDDNADGYSLYAYQPKNLKLIRQMLVIN